MKTLFDALSEIARILTPFAPSDERRAIASKLVGARAGTENENIGFRYIDIGRLFHPGNENAAAELADDLKRAREEGELQSIIPVSDGHILATDLLTYPQCPPVSEKNPLSYWIPVTENTGTASVFDTGSTTRSGEGWTTEEETQLLEDLRTMSQQQAADKWGISKTRIQSVKKRAEQRADKQNGGMWNGLITASKKPTSSK